MTESNYNLLLPHKEFLDATYNCIDKGTPISNPPRSIVDLMIGIYNEDRRPVDTGCGACVTEAIKTITILFHNHDQTSK